MSTASLRSGSYPQDDDESSRRPIVLWLLGGGGVVLLAFLLAWLFGWIRLSTDPRVAEIQKLQTEYRERFMANGGPSTLDEAKQAVAQMGQVREKIEALPPQLRGQAWAGGGGGFRTMMQQRINAYFSLPPDKRQAELDRQIKQEDLMRQAFEAARTAGGGGPGGPGGGPGGGGTARGAAGGGGPGGPGGGQAGRGGPPGGPPRGGSEDDRNSWRKRMIDSTSPQQRAQFTEYRRAMDARRDQLGLPPSQWR